MLHESLVNVLLQWLRKMAQLEREIERMLLIPGLVYHGNPASTDGSTWLVKSWPLPRRPADNHYTAITNPWNAKAVSIWIQDASYCCCCTMTFDTIESRRHDFFRQCRRWHITARHSCLLVIGQDTFWCIRDEITKILSELFRRMSQDLQQK